MSALIYHDKKGFQIIRVSKKGKQGFIVFNSKKPFAEGHTHVNNYYMCKKLIWCATHKKIDDKLNVYLLNSLLRIINQDNFKQKILERIQERELKVNENEKRST